MGKVIDGIGMSAAAAFMLTVYVCMSGWLYPCVLFCAGVEELPDGERVAILYDYFREFRYTLAENQYADETCILGAVVWSGGTPDDWDDDVILATVHAPFALDLSYEDFLDTNGYGHSVIVYPKHFHAPPERNMKVMDADTFREMNDAFIYQIPD